MGKISKEQVEALIKKALNMLYDKDKHLINNTPFVVETYGQHHVGERAIVFRLAHYMQNIMDRNKSFNNYVLDCEYNRNGERSKELPSFPNGVYPDIIIHNRGNNDNNLLIMEVKTYWNRDNTQDIKKISEFIDSNGEYHFSFGVSIVIEKNRNKVKVELLDSND